MESVRMENIRNHVALPYAHGHGCGYIIWQHRLNSLHADYCV